MFKYTLKNLGTVLSLEKNLKILLNCNHFCLITEDKINQNIWIILKSRIYLILNSTLLFTKFCLILQFGQSTAGSAFPNKKVPILSLEK